MMKGKMDIWIDEYDPLKSSQDVTEFGSVRLQELSTGRYVEEEVLNFEVTTYRTGHRLL
jgi:hypothetical protein